MLRLARARRPKLRAFTMLRHPVDQFYSFWRFLRYCASYDVEGMQAPPPNRSYDPRWSGSPLSLHEAVRHESQHCPALLPSCHSATFRALTLLAGRSGTCGDPLSGEGGLPRDLGGVNATAAEAVLLREATEAARTFDVIGFAEDIRSSLALLAHATGARPAVGFLFWLCGPRFPFSTQAPVPPAFAIDFSFYQAGPWFVFLQAPAPPTFAPCARRWGGASTPQCSCLRPASLHSHGWL